MAAPRMIDRYTLPDQTKAVMMENNVFMAYCVSENVHPSCVALVTRPQSDGSVEMWCELRSPDEFYISSLKQEKKLLEQEVRDLREKLDRMRLTTE